MNNTNEFKHLKAVKQRDTMQNIAMVVSGLYAIVPLYMMLFGYMSAEMALLLSIPASIALCVTLTLNK
jgi:hypothetical protein